MQKCKSSVKKNLVYQMLYEALVLILPFVTSPYIARVIGAEGLGVFSYTNSIAYYFVLFSMLGLGNYGNRIIAQSRDDQEILNEVFSNLVTLHMVISAICSLMYIIYVCNWAVYKKYAIIQLAYVISGLFDISWFFFGIENFRMTVFRNTVIKVLSVICIFMFVQTPDDLGKYCFIIAISVLASQLLLWIPIKKYVKFVKPCWCKMKEHIKPLVILFIPIIAISLYKIMDKVMLGAMCAKSQLGFYENADKAIGIPLTVITSFGTVMLPRMSNLAVVADSTKSQKYIAISMQFVMCVAFALAFGIAGVGEVFAPVFWGSEFTFSGVLICGLAITIPFIAFANIIRTQYLIPNKRDKDYLVSVVVGAIINLSINVVLIPRMEAVGAVIGTIFAEIVVCLIQALYVRKELPLFEYIKSFVVFFLDGALMLLCVLYIGRCKGNSVSTVFIQITVGGVIYVILVSAFFVITKNQIFFSMVHALNEYLKKLGGFSRE